MMDERTKRYIWWAGAMTARFRGLTRSTDQANAVLQRLPPHLNEPREGTRDRP